MCGISGPYIEELFTNHLRSDRINLMNTINKEDFGGNILILGLHPDPNLVYAKEIVQK